MSNEEIHGIIKAILVSVYTLAVIGFKIKDTKKRELISNIRIVVGILSIIGTVYIAESRLVYSIIFILIFVFGIDDDFKSKLIAVGLCIITCVIGILATTKAGMNKIYLASVIVMIILSQYNDETPEEKEKRIKKEEEEQKELDEKYRRYYELSGASRDEIEDAYQSGEISETEYSDLIH